MAVSATTLKHDVVVTLRDTLATNITDPVSGARAGNEKFIMTSFPQRSVRYPVIIVDVSNMSDEFLGMGTEQRLVNIEFQLDIWGRTAQERDELYDAVYQHLRTLQLDASTGTVALGLYDFNITSAVQVDEEGINAPHRVIITGTYKFTAQT